MMKLTNGGEGRGFLVIGAVSGLSFMIGVAALYSTAATIGLPLPKPVFNVEFDKFKTSVEERLGQIEAKQIETILATLRGQLRVVEREISGYETRDKLVPPSAVRERDRLERQINFYEQQLLQSR